MADAYLEELPIIHLRMYQVRKLKELNISADVFNTEGMMLLLNKNYKTNGKRMLFKYLDLQEIPSIMDRKVRILTYLNSSPYRDSEDLIIPNNQIYVDGDLAGFAMALIEHHKNLGHLLHSPAISFAKKKELLKQLGNLIDRVDRIESDHKLYFGDLNEYNFILDEENKMKAVDLDSSHIENLEGVDPPSMAYYLLKNPSLWSFPGKYKRTPLGVLIPNKDTDLYSYQMILLDVLANHHMFIENMDIYFRYLEYLKEIGVPEGLVDMFAGIYSQKSNKNPRSYIDELDDNLTHKSSYKQFQKKRYF